MGLKNGNEHAFLDRVGEHNSDPIYKNHSCTSSREGVRKQVSSMKSWLTHAHLKLTRLAREKGGVAPPPNWGEVRAHFYNLGTGPGVMTSEHDRSTPHRRLVDCSV